jgi:hypothetical protein
MQTFGDIQYATTGRARNPHQQWDSRMGQFDIVRKKRPGNLGNLLDQLNETFFGQDWHRISNKIVSSSN